MTETPFRTDPASSRPRAARVGAAFLACAGVALLATFAAAAPATLEQARAALLRGDDDGAIAILEKMVGESPKNAAAHLALAEAYGSKAQKSGMFGAATYAPKMKQEFETAVALDPKLTEARFGLVEFYAMAPPMMGGSPDKAQEQAKAIQALDPVLGHRALALIYTQQKKPDQARQEYLDAIREQPRSGKAHGYYGVYLANVEKNYPAALAECEAALRVDPAYMPALYHLGRIAAVADTNLARGEDALRKYVAYTPRENEPSLARAHYFLGSIYDKQGKKAEAKKSYQAALALNPTLKDAADALKRVP